MTRFPAFVEPRASRESFVCSTLPLALYPLGQGDETTKARRDDLSESHGKAEGLVDKCSEGAKKAARAKVLENWRSLLKKEGNPKGFEVALRALPRDQTLTDENYELQTETIIGAVAKQWIGTQCESEVPNPTKDQKSKERSPKLVAKAGKNDQPRLPVRTKKKSKAAGLAKAEVSKPAGSEKCEAQSPTANVSKPAGSKKSKAKSPGSMALAALDQPESDGRSSEKSWITECSLWKGNKKLLRDIVYMDGGEYAMVAGLFAEPEPQQGSLNLKVDIQKVFKQSADIVKVLDEIAPRDFEKDAMEFLSIHGFTNVPTEKLLNLTNCIKVHWRRHVYCNMIWFGSRDKPIQNQAAYFPVLLEGVGDMTEAGKKKILVYFLTGDTKRIDLKKEDIIIGPLSSQQKIFEKLVKAYIYLSKDWDKV